MIEAYEHFAVGILLKDIQDLFVTESPCVINHIVDHAFLDLAIESQMSLRMTLGICLTELGCQGIPAGNLPTGRYHLPRTDEKPHREFLAPAGEETERTADLLSKHGDKRQECLAEDGQFDRYSDEEAEMAVMLAEKDQHRLIEDVHIAER